MEIRKVVFISMFTPTPSNIGGPSSLPYQIIKFRESNIQIFCYSFNHNAIPEKRIAEISQELQICISTIYSFFTRHCSNLRVFRFLYNKFYKYPIQSKTRISKNLLRKINLFNPDVVWIYPYFYFNIAEQLSTYRIIVTGPDCSALHFYRVLNDSFTFKSKKYFELACKEYKRRINLDQRWGQSSVLIHLVGFEDYKYMKKISSARICFMRHPHNSYLEKSISFSKEKYKILISGNNDIYNFSDTKYLIHLLVQFSSLKSHFDFFFVGENWENYAELLTKSGYRIEYVRRVENYLMEIIKSDIQIFPISVGTGTKNKVLDALSCGLLCIGSKYAFENICVQNNKSCLIYYEVHEIIKILFNIVDHPEFYEDIATQGLRNVRLFHDPSMISKKFFRHIFNYENNCF